MSQTIKTQGCDSRRDLVHLRKIEPAAARSPPPKAAGSERKGGFITCFLARETYSPMGQAHGGPSTNARSPFG